MALHNPTNNTWWKKITDALEKQFDDITTIDVITAVADNITSTSIDLSDLAKLKDVQANKIISYARTKMELDGDYFMLLPDSNSNTNGNAQAVIETHKENTRLAIQNWNSLARTTLTAGLIVAEMLNAPVPPKAKELIEKVGFGA